MSDTQFKVFPVKFNKVFNVPQELLLKQHKIRKITEDRPPDLTLFVRNVPPYCTEESLKSLFERCGPVKDVLFGSSESPNTIFPKQDSKFFLKPEPKGYKVAYVVFSTPKGLQNALSWKPKEPVSLSTKKCPIITGYKKWCEQYTVPDSKEIMSEVNEYMKKYDEETKLKSELEKTSAEPDDEGWITVTKSGRRPGFSRRKEGSTKSIKKRLKKRKKKELLNFYTFQIKESKMKHLATLREQFERDKQKIEDLKSKRKFRPF